MESASINRIKAELNELSQKQLVDTCIALGRYKKDNKEYLDYLLFHAHDKHGFILSVKELIDKHFNDLNTEGNLYYVKKSLRKLLRIIVKYSKYLANKNLTAELHLYFCKKFKASGIAYQKSQQLINMYEQQIKKIKTTIASLHEDLQSDYLRELDEI